MSFENARQGTWKFWVEKNTPGRSQTSGGDLSTKQTKTPRGENSPGCWSLFSARGFHRTNTHTLPRTSRAGTNDVGPKQHLIESIQEAVTSQVLCLSAGVPRAISTVSDPSGSGRVDMVTGPVAAARAVVATGAWVKSKHDMYLIRGSVGA